MSHRSASVSSGGDGSVRRAAVVIVVVLFGVTIAPIATAPSGGPHNDDDAIVVKQLQTLDLEISVLFELHAKALQAKETTLSVEVEPLLKKHLKAMRGGSGGDESGNATQAVNYPELLSCIGLDFIDAKIPLVKKGANKPIVVTLTVNDSISNEGDHVGRLAAMAETLYNRAFEYGAYTLPWDSAAKRAALAELERKRKQLHVKFAGTVRGEFFAANCFVKLVSLAKIAQAKQPHFY